MTSWPYLKADMMSKLMGTDRPVEQPKNRLGKTYTFQNFTVSSQFSVRVISPPTPYGGLEDLKRGRAKAPVVCLMIGFSCRITSVYTRCMGQIAPRKACWGTGAISALQETNRYFCWVWWKILLDDAVWIKSFIFMHTNKAIKLRDCS